MLTLSFFLGFGLAACSQSSGDQGEPVDNAAEVNPADQTGAAGDGADAAEAVAKADADQEQTAVADVTPSEAAPVLEEAPPPELADTGAPEAPKAEEALPDHSPEVVAVAANSDQTTDTVKAELTDEPPELPAPAAVEAAPVKTAPEVPAADALADSFEAKAPVAPAPDATASALAGMTDSHVDGNSVSSPGAARYIKSRHDNGQPQASAARGKKGRKVSPAAAAAGSGADYVVVSGDTLGTISRKVYGSPKEWKSLAELNGLKAPYLIRVGELVKFDATNDKAKAFLAQQQGSMKTVVVKSGDSLSKIAQAVYGDMSKWKQLLGYNRDQISNPNQIEVGMTLHYVEAAGGQPAAAAAAAPAPEPAKAAVKAKGKGGHAKTAKGHKKKKAAAAQPAE